ncbi:class I SAM-dependent methyltransferase [Leptospira sp. 96542]|nr:class I SAM-dependent methyltransferase [Leptospira sp. 96542]
MDLIPCNSCGSVHFKPLFSKDSPLGERFQIVSCSGCSLVQVNPQPTIESVKKYYDDSYFTQRSDRGYDNYYSEKIKTEISRVFRLNLEDLGFFDWESKRKLSEKFPLRSLDIGCAAGYFVDYMKSSGYEAFGIEIADGPVKFARENLGLTIHQENFLDWDKGFSQSFDVITLWATIEHLHQPKETLAKIFKHLKPGGVLILSTCRYGLLAKWMGKDWRYMNVPEHLYYYSLGDLKHSLLSLGYTNPKSFSYGSGMTTKPNQSYLFSISKKIFDVLVKRWNMGDMMVFMASKPNL